MRIPDAELSYMAPAVAREYLRNPLHPAADATLERMQAAITRRGLVTVGELMREILRPLETETGPTGPAVRAEVSPEG